VRSLRAFPIQFQTTNMPSRSRGAISPEACWIFPRPFQTEGAGKAGCALHPRSRVQKCASKNAHEHTGQRRHSDFPCAMVYGLYRALPGDRAFLPPSPALPSANLTPASGCQDHTTSPSASQARRQRAAASTAARPYVRDVRETPLRVEQDAIDVALFVISENQNIFCKGALQTFG
jgi:hypothetical protein